MLDPFCFVYSSILIILPFHHSFNRILFSCFSFTRYSSSFFIRLLTSRIVRPDIPCSFAFSSNSLIEISFLSASSSLISFAPRSSFALFLLLFLLFHLTIHLRKSHRLPPIESLLRLPV